MEFRLTGHAVDKMREYEFTRRDVDWLLEHADHVLEGQTADEYYGTLDGLPYCVVITHHSPPRVITVYEVDR